MYPHSKGSTIKVIAGLLLATFLTYQISWAYPSFDQPTTLAIEPKFQLEMINPEAIELQQNFNLNAKLGYSIIDIADYLYKNGRRIESLEDAIGNSSKGVHAGIGLKHIVPLTYLKQWEANGTRPEMLSETMPQKDIAVIPYEQGQKKFLVYVAAKDNFRIRGLEGYDWPISSEYRVKVLPVDEKSADAVPQESSPLVSITDALVEKISKASNAEDNIEKYNEENGKTVDEEFIARLKTNGDINYWDTEIRRATLRDHDKRKLKILLERGNNRLKVLELDLPNVFFKGRNRGLCVKYLTATIYNEVVCEGAKHIVLFMKNKKEEKQITNAVSEEMRQQYERIHIYGNFGKAIKVSDSSNFNFNFHKELHPKLHLDPEYEKDKCFLGVDVGGTNIKVAIMVGNEVVHSFPPESVEVEGGEALKDQIIDQIKKAQKWVRLNVDKNIESLGITFPSPVKINPDRSVEIVRMTNFERLWSKARNGNSDFSEDYRVLNNIAVDVEKQLKIENIAILNDADAFGFGEIFNRISKGETPEDIGTKVILPIGTGPGYVKIQKGEIENIPNQGGHMVIDLSKDASRDPGCEVKGCYGGYVPGSALALRRKRLNIKVTDRDHFVPADLGDALKLLADISESLAAETVKIHKITGTDEVILAGGISSGYTGKELARATNDFISKKYPAYKERVKVVLSGSDLRDGGAIGAARYAMAVKNTREIFERSMGDEKEQLKFAHDLPVVNMGKNNIDLFFKEVESEKKKPCVLITRGLSDFLMSCDKYPWFSALHKSGDVYFAEEMGSINNLVEIVDKKQYDIIIPIGAGTVTDWGKYVGWSLKKETVPIPSTLSANGMFTEKAIFYEGEGPSRERVSKTSGPPKRVVIDLEFLRDIFDFNSGTGIDAERANRAGSGDILSIYPALLDWELALAAGRESKDEVIMNTAIEILELTRKNAALIRNNTDLGIIILSEIMAEASLLNMRFGSSRPKDGSEHLLADEIDALMPKDVAKLHCEQVAIASMIMGCLYSSNYDPRVYTYIKEMVVALGLPSDPSEIGMTKEMIVKALQNVKVRKDKYTYFDRFGADFSEEKAEEIYEKVFGSRQHEIEEFHLDVNRYVNNSVKAMFEHIQNNVIPNLDRERTKELVDLLLETKKSGGRVIMNAAGRIGEVVVFFQQKLRALGFNVDDFKEITPEFLVNKEDLVLTFSGSGKTFSVVDNLKNVDEMHKKGKLDRKIFSITASPGVDTWDIGREYHHVMEIKGRSKDEIDTGDSSEGDRYLPLSSTFEYSAMLYLEGIIEVLARETKDIDEAQIINIVSDIVDKTPSGIKEDLTKKLQENEEVTEEFVNLLLTAVEKDKGEMVNKKKVYLFGLGQNNHVIRLFARRIQNIGFEVYVPGPRDIISKSRKGDIAIFVSNSGSRGTMHRKIKTAQSEGCYNVVITADPNSDLAKEGDIVIPISKESTEAHTADIMIDGDESRQSRQIKRNFEIASMFYLEGVSVALMKLLGVESKDLQHVAKEWELKGEKALPSNPIIEKLISEDKMVEIIYEEGQIAAYKVKYIDGYMPGEMDPKSYRGDKYDISRILTKEETANVSLWIRNHQLNGQLYVKFRIAQGMETLKWKDSIEHSNIAHAGERDKCIYLGEKLFKIMFADGNEFIVNEILDKDEFRHIQGLDHGSEQEVRARLSLVKYVIKKSFRRNILKRKISTWGDRNLFGALLVSFFYLLHAFDLKKDLFAFNGRGLDDELFWSKTVEKKIIPQLRPDFKNVFLLSKDSEEIMYERNKKLFVNVEKIAKRPRIIQYFYYFHEMFHLNSISSNLQVYGLQGLLLTMIMSVLIIPIVTCEIVLSIGSGFSIYFVKKVIADNKEYEIEGDLDKSGEIGNKEESFIGKDQDEGVRKKDIRERSKETENYGKEAEERFKLLNTIINNRRSRLVEDSNVLIRYIKEEDPGFMRKGLPKQINRDENVAKLFMKMSVLLGAVANGEKWYEEKWEDRKDLPNKVRFAAADISKNIDKLEVDNIISSIIILARRAKQEKQRMIIGVELDWIPRGPMNTKLDSLISEMKKLIADLGKMGLDNLVLVNSNSENLAGDIFSEMRKRTDGYSGETKPSNVIVLASNSTIKDHVFNDLRSTKDNPKRALLAGVNMIDIGEKSGLEYQLNPVEITRMLSIAVDFALGKFIDVKDLINLKVEYDGTFRNIIFWPKAVPMDYKSLLEQNERKLLAVKSA